MLFDSVYPTRDKFSRPGKFFPVRINITKHPDVLSHRPTHCRQVFQVCIYLAFILHRFFVNTAKENKDMKVENSYTPLFVTNHKYSAEQIRGSKFSPTGMANVSFSIDDQKSLIRQHFGQTQDSAGWDPRADLNGDGIINVLDKVALRNLGRKQLVSQQFGKTSKHTAFDPKADLNKDGVVNVLDKVISHSLSLKV
jgi:hypothetical protein